MRRSKDDVSKYVERIRPYLTSAYRRAHVILANASCAEYVLQNVIADAYRLYCDWPGASAFREGVYSATRQIAMGELNQQRDATGTEPDTDDMLERSLYKYYTPQPDDLPGQALHARILREKLIVRRILMLRYGCGLNTVQIGNIVDYTTGDVRSMLRLCMERLMREKGREAGSAQLSVLEARLTRLSSEALSRYDDDVPEMSAVFSLFSEDVTAPLRRRGFLGRALRGLLVAIGALICALLFWLIAVLLEPHNSIEPQRPRQEEPAQVEQAYRLPQHILHGKYIDKPFMP